MELDWELRGAEGVEGRDMVRGKDSITTDEK